MLLKFWKKQDKVYFLEAILETDTGETIFWSGTLAIGLPIELEATGERVKQWVLKESNDVPHNRKAVRYVRTTKLFFLHDVYRDKGSLQEYIE